MSCFGCTWPLESVPAEQTDQVAFGSRVLPPPVLLAAQLRLPTPLQLQGGDRLNILGKGWIAHGQFLLDIYVPDKPVDPAAMALCAVDYWTQEQSRLKGMLRHHSLLEQHTTGNSTNLTMDGLRAQITVVEQELESAKKGTAPSPRDVKTVHAFWAEVTHFRHEVLSQGKIEHLVQSLDVGDEGSQMREQVMQESIAGLCQRLDVGYSTLLDLSAPIHWALFQLKLGLRLLSHSIELRQDIHLDEKIPLYRSFVVFPTVHAVDLLHDRPWQGSRHSSSPATTLQLYLLASAMNEQSGGIGIARMDEMFEQVLLLWLKDRANEDQAAKDAQSLFKSKTIDYDAMTELEAEEEEFRSLFPTYDDVEGHQEKASQQGGPSLDAEHLQAIVRVHLHLFSTHKGGSSTRTVFNRLRETLLEDLVATPSLLPETLDQDGFATQLSLVHHRSLAARSINPSTGFDFYHDASIPEAEKAAKIVQAMNLRLEELIQEWPDQMVLQHLRDRCQTVLGLSLVSPIAKILTSLEQLLLQSEDWEMYANRHNSLRTYREDLTKTIVDWRRLELSCWSTLLQVQLRVFEDQAAEWWPNLYNVCVRGALAVAVDTEAASLDKYLDDLVPLVDNLLASSPLGQLARRLEMVQAFAHLLDGLISSRSEREGDILRRVGNILRTTGDYYRQFTPAIATSFNQQRAALEKDIRGYIKLASWKDVNVQALKASAVRTHHQLYKTIRKFRDIMRQPITPHLTLDGQSEKSIANPPSDYSFPIADEHDSRMPIRIEGSSSRAADLPRTLTMFDSFVKERIVPAISSRDSINIDHLASDIIQRSQTLARATIPADTPSEKRASAQKALFVLKRKAWTDLLKELKRIGLATAVKPDILERQRNLRWLREQRGLGRDDDIGVETYIQRVQVVLPQLRNALADHHADLSTRDLNRATMFVESGLEFGLEARSRCVLLPEAPRMRTNR
jgi:midasin